MPEKVKDEGQGAEARPGFTIDDRQRRIEAFVRWSMELALTRVRGNE